VCSVYRLDSTRISASVGGSLQSGMNTINDSGSWDSVRRLCTQTTATWDKQHVIDIHWLDIPQRIQYKLGVMVLDWLLHPDVRYCQSSASPNCYSPSIERTTTLLQQVWTSGFLCYRSKGLEPFTWSSLQSITHLWLLQISTEDIPLHNTPGHVAQ